MKEIIAETFYCLVSPDGDIQWHTINDDPGNIEAICSMLAEETCTTYEELIELGYTLQEIKLTITKP